MPFGDETLTNIGRIMLIYGSENGRQNFGALFPNKGNRLATNLYEISLR